MRIVGFTASRNGLSKQQSNWLWKFALDEMYIHHGGCIGGDYEVHHAAVQLGHPVTVHPPKNKSLAVSFDNLRSPYSEVTFMAAKDYLERDRDIVNSTDSLVGFPDGPPRPKSGTWYTITYAITIGTPVTIVYPDGTVETRKP